MLFKVHFQRFGVFCGLTITNGFINAETQEDITLLKSHHLFNNGIEQISPDEEINNSHDPHITYKEHVKLRPNANKPFVNPFDELFTQHEYEQIRSLDGPTKESIKKGIQSILNDRFSKAGNQDNAESNFDPELDEGEDLSDLTQIDTKVTAVVEKQGLAKEVLSSEAGKEQQPSPTLVAEKPILNIDVSESIKIEPALDIPKKADLLEDKTEYELRLILEGLEDENHQPIKFDPDADKSVLIELIKKYEALREDTIINKA